MVQVQPTKETTLIDAAREARRRERLPNVFWAGFLQRFHSLLRRASRAEWSAFAVVGWT
jgi:hypothetical protein